MSHLGPAFLYSCLLAPCAIAQATWSLQYPATSPPARSSAAMASHDATGKVVLFGGAGIGSTADCWIFDASGWTQFNGFLPPQRVNSAMVYDSARARLVMFGGDWGGELGDTWEWDGTAWIPRTPVIAPSPRGRHGMAYDQKRGVTVLFGGEDASGNQPLNEVWEWDGNSWVDKTPATGPTGRWFPNLAFDPVRQDILMYGGYTFTGPSLETWSWDGTSWQQQMPPTPPPYRRGNRAVSDLHRQRVIVYGDESDPFSWEWDGQDWTMLVQSSPGVREAPAVAYNGQSRETVVFGGYLYSVHLADTWVFRTNAPADVIPFGAGCPGATGLPVLAGAPYTLPWVGDVYRSELTNLAPATAATVFATGNNSTAPMGLANVGMPGCDLLVSFAALELIPAANQRSEWLLTIPNSTALAGVRLFQQGFALEPGANAAGITASNGIELVVGIR